jgi:hypothetical protein
MIPRERLWMVRGGLTLSAALALPFTAYAAGFADDANSTLTLRNYYINRNFVDEATQNKAEEWTQSFILDTKSGFTEGPVGLGMDVLSMWSVKLDGGKGTTGTQLLPVHGDGRPADEFGRLAGAGKLRFSKTELKVGEWALVLPILASNDGRSLPQTFQGGMLTSKEIQNLTLYIGRVRGNSPRNDASLEELSWTGNAHVTSDRFNFTGAEYTFNEGHTMIGIWFAQLEDIYKQRYFQVVHNQPLGKDWTFGANIGYFNGEEDGNALAGKLDNKVLSNQFLLKSGSHTFTLGLQRVTGDNQWLRVNGTSGGILVNDSFNASYDNARERSWQLRYDYNFAAIGIPGMTFMTRYISGSNVHAGSVTDGKEWGRESELAYVMQSGVVKNLALRWRFSSMRRDWGVTNSFDEQRLVVSYPVSLF